jgi:hypothetical protein
MIVNCCIVLIVLNTVLKAAMYVKIHIASNAELPVAAMIAFNPSVQNV